jgi:hypothetical protein
MPRIRVLKPFVFSRLPAGDKLATEKHYPVGEHDIDEEMADHPWIRDHHADGRIESPAQTALRLEHHAVNLQQAAESAALASAEAQAAFARLTAAQPGAKASAEEIQKQLNTPVNILRGGGKAPVKTDAEAAAEAAAAADDAATKAAADNTLKLKTGTK